ncbi:MAG: DUF6449 domain-containing protein [Johnsonella sp.]|nr:DUF6449 domain-containing protein [Johnsonella sp.]
MTSKNLFFNLMREDLKRRLWSIALCVLIFFFSFPVASALMISSYSKQNAYLSESEMLKNLPLVQNEIFRTFSDWNSRGNFLISFLLLLLALVLAISGFSYLQSAKKTDFYHSLPVSRKMLFSLVTLDGILIIALPYFVMSMISAAMVCLSTGHQSCFQIAASAFLINISLFLFCYITAVLAVLLTGHVVVSVLGIGVFYTILPIILMLKFGLNQTFFKTYYYDEDILFSQLLRSSPMTLLFDPEPERLLTNTLLALGGFFILTLLSFFVYQIRPSEAAGKAMAFFKSRVLIKFLIVIPAALSGALWGYSIMESDGWGIFGLICALIISYCTVEIIYHFDFKKLFSYKLHLLLCALLSIGIFAVYRFDLIGYDRYLPSKDALRSAGIYSTLLEENQYKLLRSESLAFSSYDGKPYLESVYRFSEGKIIEKMQYTDQDVIYKIAETGIAQRRPSRHYSYDGEPQTTVYFSYHLKSGRKVLRQYTVKTEDIKEELDLLYDSGEFKSALYPIFDFDAEKLSSFIYEYGAGYLHTKAGKEETGELFSIYLEEFASLSSETRRKENPIGSLRFNTEEEDENISILKREREKKDREGIYRDLEGFYPIYPSFQKTIAKLKEIGTDPYVLRAENISKITLQIGGGFEREKEAYYEEQTYEAYSPNSDLLFSEREAEITGKEEIRQILESASPENLKYTNSFRPKFTQMSIRAKINKHPDDAKLTSSEIYLIFDADKVPDFVREAFGLTQADIRYYTTFAY